jgi:dihydroorotate dehydrogenase (NAD+) catalytic subunit
VQLPRYHRLETYRWNYDHAPTELPVVDVPSVGGEWTFCGRPVRSPLGIAAGPLLNGRWLLYYAALGFDVLTYKTTRSRARECYPLPNLQPVASPPMTGPVAGMPAASEMLGSWAVSFGMPSKPPEDWRADVTWTRDQLPPEKLLSVSVVATPQPEWAVDDLAADFAQCARWAIDSGADAVETNFSCPNVSTRDGQLYQQPREAGLVAQRVRDAIGPAPYLIKIGFVRDAALAAELLDAVGPFADGLSMTNCISATVHDSRGKPLFDNQPRGIGGDAIRSASIAQVAMFAELIRDRALPLRLVGVGGISQAEHVREYLAAGAESVHLASAIMVNPEVGVRIRRELAT